MSRDALKPVSVMTSIVRVMPVIGHIRAISVMWPITSYRPQAHELDFHYREMIVVVTHLADIDIDDFASQCYFTFFLENFRVIKTGFAGDETSIGLISDFGPH